MKIFYYELIPGDLYDITHEFKRTFYEPAFRKDQILGIFLGVNKKSRFFEDHDYDCYYELKFFVKDRIYSLHKGIACIEATRIS